MQSLLSLNGRAHRERFPKGIEAPDRDYHRAFESGGDTVLSWSPTGYHRIRSHDFRQRTFEVEPRHEALEGKVGVNFNIETVSEALAEDRNMPRLDAEEYRSGLCVGARAAYQEESKRGERSQRFSATEDIRVEQASRQPEGLVHSGGHGFLAAAMTAFARHLPLTLSPDAVWAQIAWGFAKHVDNHADALRSNFVQHEGKKRLLVVTSPSFRLGLGESFEASSPPERWEHEIFPKFSTQIGEHIGDETHHAIAGDFSTTNAGARAAFEVTLMAAMKNYFSFGCRTMCGIPSITLTGTLEDWQQLRARAEALGEKMMPEFRDKWMACLLPVLDEFVNSYRGEVNFSFWQTMVKLRSTGGGSGSHSFISGWISILYPYLANGQANILRPWAEMFFHGPESSDFPATTSSVPCDWEYHGTQYDLHFHAGIIGFTQDSDTGSLEPVLGWSATHDPNSDPESRLAYLEREIVEIRKGHPAAETKDGEEEGEEEGEEAAAEAAAEARRQAEAEAAAVAAAEEEEAAAAEEEAEEAAVASAEAALAAAKVRRASGAAARARAREAA